jgi:hypothetical protein
MLVATIERWLRKIEDVLIDALYNEEEDPDFDIDSKRGGM